MNNEMLKKWLATNLVKLKSIDSIELTSDQQEIIDLAEQDNWSDADEKRLGDLVDNEKSRIKQETAERKQVKVQQWLDDNLPILKAYKKPTEAQRDLIDLADKPNRTDDENRYLFDLVAAEKAYQSYQSRISAISDRKKIEAAQARKLENGQKIIDGGWLRQQVMTNKKTRDWYLKNAPKAITRKADIERMKPYWEELAKLDAPD